MAQKQTIIIQNQKDWIPAMLKCTTIKKIQIDSAIMDDTVINISVAFPDEQLATFEINKLMATFTTNLEKAENYISKLKLIQFKKIPSCKDEFPDCIGQ